MKKSFIATFVILFSIALNATAALQVREGRTIQGHVLEDGSEENIAFASVLVVETGDGTVSNEEGQFVFRNLSPGNYTLRVSMVGYETMTKEVTVSNDFTADEMFDYDMLLFFSPQGIASLMKNFPNFDQKDIAIGCFGPATAKAVKDAGLRLDLEAPTVESPSMTAALDKFIAERNKD